MAFSSSAAATVAKTLARGPMLMTFTGPSFRSPDSQRAAAVNWLACKPSGRSPTAATSSAKRKSFCAMRDSPK